MIDHILHGQGLSTNSVDLRCLWTALVCGLWYCSTVDWYCPQHGPVQEGASDTHNYPVVACTQCIIDFNVTVICLAH